MWGDRWLPMKIMNPTSEPVVLKRNTKLADVFPCIAAEDLSQPDHIQAFSQSVASAPATRSREDVERALDELGLQDLDLGACEVSDEWIDRLFQIIEKYETIFSRHKLDCGEASDFVHKIHLVDDKPFRLPYRRVPPNHYDKLRAALNDMEERGIISKSNSEYASPLVLVWKKNGDLRICTDFRWLNARTVKDAHPLPHQADALAALGGNAYFSVMDLTSGFYNVPLHEDHRKYSAFSSPFGLHEYNRMPQGLSNSPATFMRMMLSIFGDENFTSLLCYLDDIMVFAPTEQLALQRLEMVFSRLKNHNLKLAPKKCHFLRRTVKFLGHVITESGVQTDYGKVEAISQVQVSDLMDSDGVSPSQKKIRSFLGMVLYYQHFIEDCSAKARPLFRLLSEQKTGRKLQRGRKSLKKCCNPVKLTPDDWTPECQNAFDTLKHDLLHTVTLAHPDFGKPFILAVDASFDGIGAVISQLQPGEKIARPVAFASKTLSRAQLNYPAHRLEFLALKWAICDKFSHWLKGVHFTAWSDNNPLTYILTKPKLDACEQRWVAKLAAYDFDLKYVPGPKNTVADALSREPFVQSCVSHRLVKESYLSLLDEVNGVVTGTVQDTFRLTANCQTVQTTDDHADEALSPVQGSSQLAGGAISTEEVSAILDVHRTGGVSQLPCTNPESLQLPEEDPSTVIPCSQLHNLQQQDAVVSRVLFFVQRHRRPNAHERAAEPSCVLRLLKHWKKLKVRNGLLYRVKRDHHMNRKIFQFVTPESLKQQVLHGVHDAAGHQGCSRTHLLASERFFWTGMQRDVVNHVKHCQRCVLGKTPEPDARAPLDNIRTSAPMELVCIDFWTAELSNKKSADVLVVTDHFSNTVHETTGFAPFYLMFGRVPRLPVDIMFHHVLENPNVVGHHEFVHHLKKDLSEAARIAQQNAIGEQDRHAKIYNRKVRGMPLAVGDRVLLANRGERGKRKVADRWESTPFDVVSVRSTVNVYRIRDAATGKEKVVHRNMLLPVDFLTFPEQNRDLVTSGESQSNASCVSARTSNALGNREDSRSRTMNWLMQSPVQTGAESESAPEEDAVGKDLTVDVSDEDQSDELLDSVPDDSATGHSAHAHTDTGPSTPDRSLDPVHDTVQLPVNGFVALSDPTDQVKDRRETFAGPGNEGETATATTSRECHASLHANVDMQAPQPPPLLKGP
ncbi:hypothetical protein SKAU_G00276550 [Synaphobranchus kaupii]|uniref:Gypsy retrotransposon integrase-like protein 1 n=1 Tax=Synaphobranchus kaupii TaxID=118154 RepID=A0A9Q1IR47_SYNKA|nr:hypothetical protein SKAU_G00276550 [Synaphobranchus kaupii]